MAEWSAYNMYDLGVLYNIMYKHDTFSLERKRVKMQAAIDR